MADLRFKYRKKNTKTNSHDRTETLKEALLKVVARRRSRSGKKVQNHSICLNESHKVSSNPNLPTFIQIELALYCTAFCSRFFLSFFRFFLLFLSKHETSLIPLLDNLEREENVLNVFNLCYLFLFSFSIFFFFASFSSSSSISFTVIAI